MDRKDAETMNEKQLVGEKAVEYIKDGMVIGLGTGSTVFYTIQRISQLIEGGLSIRGVPTSIETELLAKKLHIPLVDLTDITHIDLAIDGADQFTKELDLIKGGGGALLREKIIANAADQFIVVADSTKMANHLGGFPLPVEVVPFGIQLTIQHIKKLGGEPVVRTTNDKPFRTDNGNYIVDCAFSEIKKPIKLEKELNMIPGVVENGLFTGRADLIISLDKDKQLYFHTAR